jgi:hypothetical protein
MYESHHTTLAGLRSEWGRHLGQRSSLESHGLTDVSLHGPNTSIANLAARQHRRDIRHRIFGQHSQPR